MQGKMRERDEIEQRRAALYKVHEPSNNVFPAPSYRHAPRSRDAPRSVPITQSSASATYCDVQVQRIDKAAGAAPTGSPSPYTVPVAFDPGLAATKSVPVVRARAAVRARHWPRVWGPCSPRRDVVAERERLAAQGPGGVGIVMQVPPLWSARPLNTLAGICI